MKKIAYLECPTGIAGDMCLGALVSSGVPLDYLDENLSRLGISDEYHLRSELVHRNGQVATKVYVDLSAGDRPQHDHDHTHDHTHDHEGKHKHKHKHDHTRDHTHDHTRHLPEIEGMIKAAKLPERAEFWSLAVFRQLAEAEGAVHGVSPNQVHFHEVGATDAIVDIVGTCLGLDWLGIDNNSQGWPALSCSPLPTGGGTVWAAHGRLPVPVPAVLQLLRSRQVPVYANGIEQELVTPTGAAIAVTLATSFGPPPAMSLHQIGLGAGSQNFAMPNILRLWIGESAQCEDQPLANVVANVETIAVLETQIDDLNPQAIAYTCERLFAVGAIDVFTQPIAMKKSRTGILLTVICRPEKVPACEQVIFQETSTLGIRRSSQQRHILNRFIQKVATNFGEIPVKVATNAAGKIINVQPEYEDCAALAKKHHLPWREIHRQALAAWYSINSV